MTTLAVTLVGVAGTLGGTLGGALLSQRARRTELAEQNRRADQDRAEQALLARRDQYARLNAAGRAYRVVVRDAVYAVERGEQIDAPGLEAAKEAWADHYAQAQMVLPKYLLDTFSDLSRALGLGYRLVKQLATAPDRAAACERGRAWCEGPMSDAVYLLRIGLRHDLGVEVQKDIARTSHGILDPVMEAYDELDLHLRADQRAAARNDPS